MITPSDSYMVFYKNQRIVSEEPMIKRVCIASVVVLLSLFFASCEKPPEKKAMTGAAKSNIRTVSIQYLIKYGNLNFEKKQYKRAVSYYTKVIKVLGSSNDSNLVNAVYNRGLAYLKMGMLDRAVEDFSSVIQISPTDYRAYYNRGNVLALKNFHDRAIEDYTRAIEINSGMAELYYNRGLTYQENSTQYDRAIEDFKMALTIQPEDAKSYCFLGITYYKKHQYQTSAQYFSRAIDIDPNYAQAVTGRGQAFLRSGKTERALSDFKKACDMGEDTGCTMLELLTIKKHEGPIGPL
jgi:tetratricopeptide (TPR) repeat protein